MPVLDWIVLMFFFLVLIVIGVVSFRKVKSSNDFFMAGGKLPWWLAGVSHHVSGYSGAVFVGYASLAYTDGFTIYVWWAFTIAISLWIGSGIFAVRWSRLRENLHVQSPLEYLKRRYNGPAQQLMAWSGALLKLFDVGAKWAAIALLLNVFTGTPIQVGILMSGGIALVYITIGGLWADVMNDFAQFIVQLLAGFVMFFVVVQQLGGVSSLWGIWDQLPERNAALFNDNYPIGFMLTFLAINFLSYNGGTWTLATRFLSSSNPRQAMKAAKLSSILYLLWPLILFFPMWAAPILIPGMEDTSQSYALLTKKFLPTGMVGLVLASMFANTMSMTSSDSNTVSSVI
ncbi:MAG: Na+:solute symporter, partial [Cyclobacteriaceae bacterium]|nr:Na+:solute symporter [Cyclobacteriaceae bacterium]